MIWWLYLKFNLGKRDIFLDIFIFIFLLINIVLMLILFVWINKSYDYLYCLKIIIFKIMCLNNLFMCMEWGRLFYIIFLGVEIKMERIIFIIELEIFFNYFVFRKFWLKFRFFGFFLKWELIFGKKLNIFIIKFIVL